MMHTTCLTFGLIGLIYEFIILLNFLKVIVLGIFLDVTKELNSFDFIFAYFFKTIRWNSQQKKTMLSRVLCLFWPKMTMQPTQMQKH